MKRGLILVAAAMVIAGTFGGGVAVAQEIAIVNVPFQFTFNQKVMAAGKYEVSVGQDQSVVSLLPAKGAAAMAPVITRLAQRAPVPNAELIFDKVGEQYALSEIWMPTMDGFLLHDTKGPHQHHSIKGTKKSS